MKASARAVEETSALSLPETVPAVVEVAGDLAGYVLDAGCGPDPAVSIELGRWPARRMVGLDSKAENVRRALDESQRLGVWFGGVVGLIDALPFRTAALDGCVCQAELEDLPDPAAGVRELGRVIRPRGRLVVGRANRFPLRSRVDGRNGDGGSTARRTPSQLIRLLRPHFRVHRRKGLGWKGGRRARAASSLVSVWIFRPFGRMTLVDLRARRRPS